MFFPRQDESEPIKQCFKFLSSHMLGHIIAWLKIMSDPVDTADAIYQFFNTLLKRNRKHDGYFRNSKCTYWTFISCAGFDESPFVILSLDPYTWDVMMLLPDIAFKAEQTDHAAGCWWAGTIEMGSIYFVETLVYESVAVSLHQM